MLAALAAIGLSLVLAPGSPPVRGLHSPASLATLTPARPRAAAMLLASGADEADDINTLVTRLNAAIASEEYGEAARLKKLLQAAAPDAPKTAAWDGAPSWLADRFFDLGYSVPTPVQSACLAALAPARLPVSERSRTHYDAVIRASTGSGKTIAYVACALTAAAEQLAERGEAAGAAVARAVEMAPGSDAHNQSSAGGGAEGVELSPTDILDILSPRLVVGYDATSPSRAPAVAVPPRGGPLAVLVAPTRELARQVAGVAYEALGGYSRSTRTYEPGARDSLFRYTGPKGGRVLALLSRRDATRLSDAEARGADDGVSGMPGTMGPRDTAEGEARGGDGGDTVGLEARNTGGGSDGEAATPADSTSPLDLPFLPPPTASARAGFGDSDVLIITPDALAYELGRLGSALEEGEAAGFLDLSVLRAVVVDEADACLGGAQGWAVRQLLASAPVGAIRLLCGASVPLNLARGCVAEGGLVEPMLVSGDGSVVRWGERGAWAGGALAEEVRGVGAEAAALVEAAERAAQGQATWSALPRSIQHKACLISDPASRGAALSALCRSSLSASTGRAVVFAKDEDEAAQVASDLRTELWGNQAVMVLLPSQGNTPLEIADGFRRAKATASGSFAQVVLAGSASVLVAPASSARGLDFRDVSFVFLLSPPVSAEEYVHAAGRAGRVGQLGRGVVVSLLAGDEEIAELERVVGGVLGMPLERLSQAEILIKGEEARVRIDTEAGGEGTAEAFAGTDGSQEVESAGDGGADFGGGADEVEAEERRRQLESALELDSEPGIED